MAICLVYGVSISVSQSFDTAENYSLTENRDAKEWMLIRILNPHGLEVNPLYYVHFYLILAIFLILNVVYSVNSKNVYQLQ